MMIALVLNSISNLSQKMLYISKNAMGSYRIQYGFRFIIMSND